MLLATLWAGAAASAAGLPLESLSYTVDVAGPLAEVMLEQTFRNDTGRFIEATYVFPLHGEAGVDQMYMWFADREIRGRVLERTEAVAVYEQAVDEGRVAALTEQDRPNVFTQTVGNIPPGAEIRVELHLVQPVPRVDGAYELVLPLVVAPRFMPAGLEDADRIDGAYAAPPAAFDGVADSGPRPGVTGVGVDIDVQIAAGAALHGLHSPSHPTADVGAEGSWGEAWVDQVPAHRDFTLRWRTDGDEPQVALLVHRGHALLTFEPPSDLPLAERVPRELIWVLDTSGSMSGLPIELSKEAMKAALGSMTPADSFMVLGFSNAVQRMAKAPLPATPANIRAGQQFVHELQASGGTQLMRAIVAALELPPDPSRQRIVCFLTDGLIGNDRQAIAAIAAAGPRATVMTAGIGASPNRYLLDELALMGGGRAVYLTPEDDPQEQLARLVDAMDRPVLTEVAIDWGDWEPVEVWPKRIPDLLLGTPTHLVARVIPGEGPIEVSGRTGSGWFSQTVHATESPAGRPITTSWARQKVAALERGILRGEVEGAEEEILVTALEYQILTDQTAFVAVDTQVTRAQSEPLDEVEQVRELPLGMEARGGFEEIVVESVRRSVQTEHTARGQVLTKEFLTRVPAGRSYQTSVQMASGVVRRGGNPNMAGGANGNTITLDGVNVTDPVSGTMSLAVRSLREVEVLGEGRMPEHGGAAESVVVISDNGSNNLELDVFVGGVVPASGEAGVPRGTAEGTLGGSIVRDRLWVLVDHGTDISSTTVPEGPDVRTVGHRTNLKLTSQPSSEHRFSASGRLAPRSIDLDGVAGPDVGGGLGTVRWQWFSSPEVSTDTQAGAQQQGRIDGRITRLDGQTRVTADAGSHDAMAAAGISALQVRGDDPAVRDDAALGRAWVQDRVDLGALTLGGGLRWEVVAADETSHLASPRAFAAVDPWQDDRTKISGGYGRYWDTGTVLPLLAGTPGRADELHLDAEREIIEDVALGVGGTWRSERLFTAPTDALQPMAAADGGGTLDRRVARFSTWLRKVESRRWGADVRWTATPWIDDPDGVGLLSDPTAPWVSGLLGPHRRHQIAAAMFWDLPTDPFAQRIGLSLGWASAIDPDGPWWLRAPLHLGLRLGQDVDLRKGKLVLWTEVLGAWSDPSAARVPVALLAAHGLRADPGDQPPVLATLGAAYEF